MKKRIIIPLFALLLICCRKEEQTQSSTQVVVTPGVANLGNIKGFYLLNEGNMGYNKASLDYFDYKSGIYNRNIYSERNPTVVKSLGDVGNDLKVYKDRLYAVINNSNLVEVMEKESATHIGSFSIQNCRYIAFSKQYGYVSSYAGAIEFSPTSRKGYIAKVDLATLTVVDSCNVGYQPEELVVVDDKLYVANSGGYMAPNYDRTVSVIDLNSFTEVKKIDVDINLHRLEVDNNKNIWVSTRGNYEEVTSKTYVIDSSSDKVVKTLDIPNSDMTIYGDSLYIYSSVEGLEEKNFVIVNCNTFEIKENNFIKDGSEKNIRMAYGIAVNPENGEIFICDARDYITPGKLYCYNPNGTLKWSVTTGDIPVKMEFLKASN